MNRLTFSVAGLIAASLLPSARADIVHLRGGGSLSGTVQPRQNGNRTLYIVTVKEGMRVSLTSGEVARIEKTGEDKLLEYQRQLANVPETAEAHWEMARWCKERVLLPQYDRHVRHVIRLDPDHATARMALGFTSYEGKWVNNDQLQRSRGLVRHLNKWKVPADVKMEEQAKQLDISRKDWLRTIKRWRGQALKPGKHSAEAIQQLKNIDDPIASSAIAELLTENTDNPQIRSLWVRLLSQWETPDAVNALIFSSLFDPDPSIREACLDRLEEYGKFQAVNTYIGMLSSQDNKKVHIAADALRAMKDPRSILPLIDALVTKHKVKQGGGPGMTTTFDRSGNSAGGLGGLSMGGKEKIVEVPVKNPPVLSALLTLAPNADYQYDEKQWRRYFSTQMSDVSFDLRRDP